LKVTDAGAIGQILGCPKCGSMVEVEPPEGWNADAAPMSASESTLSLPPISAPAADAPVPPAVEAPPVEPPPVEPTPVEAPPVEVPVVETPKAKAAAVVATPALFDEVEATTTEAVSASATSPALPAAASMAGTSAHDPLTPSASWASPVEQAWRRRLFFAVGGASLVAIVVGLVALLLSHTDPPTNDAAVDTTVTDTTPEDPPVAPTEKRPAPEQKTKEPPVAKSDPDEVIAKLPAPKSVVPPVKPTVPAEKAPPLAVPKAPPSPKIDPPPLPEPKDPPVAEPEDPRPSTPTVNVEEQLSTLVPEIAVDKIPLRRFVELMSQLSAVPITLDLDALAQSYIGSDTLVSVQMTDANVAEVLEKVLAARRLGFFTDRGHLIITRPGRFNGSQRKISAPLRGLAKDKAETQWLIETTRRLVVPKSWKAAGGKGQISTAGERLFITQSDEAIDQLVVLCDKLRVARRLSPASNYDARRFSVQTALAKAKPLLARPVTMNFRREPLEKIVRHLNQRADLDGALVLVDWHALGAAGVGPNTPATMTASKLPLADALGSLVRPLKLSLRPVDARTIQLTTRAALRAHPTLEYYPVSDLIPADGAIAGLIGRITTAVIPGSWRDAGGVGDLVYDRRSGCLLVLQSADVHVVLENLLDKMRRSRKES